MIRRCSGTCGKAETRPPWKDSRTVYYICSDCNTNVVVVNTVVVTVSGVSLDLCPRGETGRHKGLKIPRY